MANDDLVRVGVTGDVYVAPVGTTLPTDVTSPLNAAFAMVGHVSTDALTESLKITSEKIRSWQKKGGVRTVVTEYDWTWQFTLLETSTLTLEMFYGGATSATVGDVTTTTIPNELEVVQKAMVIQIVDGLIITRYAIEVAEISDRGDVAHNGSAATGYDLTVSVVGGVDDLGKRLTNDPDFSTVGS
jgi:hypothetical protein